MSKNVLQALEKSVVCMHTGELKRGPNWSGIKWRVTKWGDLPAGSGMDITNWFLTTSGCQRCRWLARLECGPSLTPRRHPLSVRAEVVTCLRCRYEG